MYARIPRPDRNPSAHGQCSRWQDRSQNRRHRKAPPLQGKRDAEHMFMAMSEAKGPETTIFISFYLNQPDTVYLNDSTC